MYRLFDLFLQKMKASFQRIARATRHEFTAEDLKQDAWIIGEKIGSKRGRPIDYSDPVDQDLVIRSVHHQRVKRGDWRLRKSIRIDQELESDDGAIKWSERLPAQASSDPLIALLLRESALDAEAMLAASYSQATAYVMVFVRLKNNREDVCAYLVVSEGTLSRRVTAAADTVRVQPSLFDRVERISSSFIPPRGRQYATRATETRIAAQWGWEF